MGSRSRTASRISERAAACVLGVAAAFGPIVALGGPADARPVLQDPKEDDAALLAEERRDADLERRRGKPESALSRFRELLDDDASDVEARLGVARCLADLCRWDEADAEARAVLAAAKPKADAAPATPTASAALRLVARLLTTRGRAAEAVELLDAEPKLVLPKTSAEDAWTLGKALLEAGKRERALATFGLGARGSRATAWTDLLAQARCRRALGDLTGASESLVAADEAASKDGGSEPEVLAELADVYFEADREVDDVGRNRKPQELYKEARRLDATNEVAALGQYRLHRFNWLIQKVPAQKVLAEFLAARPDSIEGLIAATSADLDDGQLKSARERLAKLDQLAKGRRAVRALHAGLAWIEHREDDCTKELAALVAEDPRDAAPEREVGKHLLELYRFAEGLPFVRAATERDPKDWEAWTQLGRALANTGDEKAALIALKKADEVAAGRQDAWRNNMRLVLTKMEAEHEHEKGDALTFAWNEDAAEILRTYLVPFYEGARKELAQRYGFTPGPTAIEVFSKHADFSVRSTGFEGFPALGVCFGPVVTAVSPLCELRGTFSWARTSFHEFTHVIHLGLSHNRCPRWVTEGLATWEEVNANPAWTRNMRRDLVDALANDDLIPVRELNRAFRGPRILFGYYQGGLLCQMLIDRSGFPPMVRLLEAFDRGADVDQAFQDVYKESPEDVDREFRAFVTGLVRGLAIEPRWTESKANALRATLSTKPPAVAAGTAKRDAWIDGWCTIAWQAWQDGRRVDAQEALRAIADVTPPPARAQFLRGEMKLKTGDRDGARTIWEAAIASGAEDYRVRMALGVLARDAKDDAAAEKHFLAAERAFPGYDEKQLSAELALSQLYETTERHDDAMKALERWLVYESGSFPEAFQVATWHADAGRNAESLKFFRTANEIDPFRWRLHDAWSKPLAALGKKDEALREVTVALEVPASLEGDRAGPPTDAERARLLGTKAALLLDLSRTEDALDAARKALELDADCEAARAVLERAR